MEFKLKLNKKKKADYVRLKKEKWLQENQGSWT